jgi:hypothetical protein
MPCPSPENFPPLGLASEIEAFQATAGMKHCPSKDTFPFNSTRWGLAATGGAYHAWHLDCDGFATYIYVKTGSKWWTVGRPKNCVSIADTTLFTGDFEVNRMNMDLFDYEAIYLRSDCGL